MLSPAEHDLTRRNQEIPGLATVLNPEALVGALRETVPYAHLNGARIQSVKLEPHTYCRVGYQVIVDGQTLDLDVRACRSEDLEAWTRESRDGPMRTPLGLAPIVIADRAMVIG